MKNVADILPRIVSPFERHCSACGMQPGDAYVTTPLIGIGVTPLHCSHAGSQLLDHIIAFDRAEAETANITQTNLVAVSSFNGPQGLLWGYDLLPQPLQQHPLLNGGTCDIYDAAPLFAATQALYGTIARPRFPLMSGQHVLCAYKTVYRNGPCLLYGALAVAIAADRGCNADLFLEDHGTLIGLDSEADGSQGVEAQEAMVLRHLVDAVGKIGHNLGVAYEKVFLGLRACPVPAGHVGCVLTAAPYVHLARQAVPRSGLERLRELSVSEWERSLPFP